MEFLTAFILGGSICLIFQVFMTITKTELPLVIILALVVGAFLAASGIAEQLELWGGAGIAVLVVGAGQALFMTTQLALSTGDIVPLITVWCVFVALTIIGIVTGALHRSVAKTAVDVEEQGVEAS